MPICCDCAEGLDTAWDLPRFNIAMKMQCYQSKFPHEWFKPTNGLAELFGQKMEQWKAKIKLAEEFWKHNMADVT